MDGYRSLVGRHVGGLSGPFIPTVPGYRSFFARHLGGLSALAFTPPPPGPPVPPPALVNDGGGHGRRVQFVAEDRRAQKRRARENLALLLGRGHL